MCSKLDENTNEESVNNEEKEVEEEMELGSTSTQDKDAWNPTKGRHGWRIQH